MLRQPILLTNANMVVELPESIDNFDFILFELKGSDANKGFFHSLMLSKELNTGIYSLVQSSAGSGNGFLDFTVPTRNSFKILSWAYLTHIQHIYGIRI